VHILIKVCDLFLGLLAKLLIDLIPVPRNDLSISQNEALAPVSELLADIGLTFKTYSPGDIMMLSSLCSSYES